MSLVWCLFACCWCFGALAAASADHSKGTTQQGGLAKYVASLIDKTLNWEDIAWVRQHCGKMKIVVKVHF